MVGLQDACNFAVLDAPAETIGNAAVGPSRPVVDAGRVPCSMMIGQTATPWSARSM